MDSCVIRLKTGGEQAPLFLVEGIVAARSSYGELARDLGDGRSVFGIEGPFLPDGGHEFPGIEERARQYLQAVRRIQTKGPYLLGGYCLGGNIAFEMAQRLCADGEEIAFLVLFDSEAPMRSGAGAIGPTQTLLALGRNLRGKGGIVWRSLLPQFWSHLRDFAELLKLALKGADVLGVAPPTIREACVFVWRNIRMRDALVVGGFPPEELVGIHRSFAVVPQFWQMQRRTSIASQALDDYNGKMQPYPGTITLFVSAQGHQRGDEITSALGWKHWAEGGVTVHGVPGNHEMLLRSPRVTAVAAELQRHLDLIA